MEEVGVPLKENAQGQQRRGFPPYSPTPRLKMYPLHPGLGSEEEEEERGGGGGVWELKGGGPGRVTWRPAQGWGPQTRPEATVATAGAT